MNSVALKQVPWRDLTTLSVREMLIENNITVPWALVSWGLAYYGHYWLALPFSALFFLTALRQVHNGFHNSLGTGRRLTWLSLYLNSILMVASIHAVKFNHLRHHRYCLSEEDYEGKAARMRWYEAILYGPRHMWLVHRVTWQLGGRRYRLLMLLELASIGAFAAVVLALQVKFLLYHLAAMVVGELLSAFFAVWSVHHDCDEHTIARTQRTGWKNFVTYSMFYHLEHHLFPAVPTSKLPELARRLDATLPELEKKPTF